jgi:hypothetical protein
MLLSWIPAPLIVQLIVAVPSSPPSSAATHALTAVIWTCEILIGVLGVWLAGKETVALVRAVGWRRTPRAVWNVFAHSGEASAS